jgi:hypothetical protein
VQKSDQQTFPWIPIRYISDRSDKNQVSYSRRQSQEKIVEDRLKEKIVVNQKSVVVKFSHSSDQNRGRSD